MLDDITAATSRLLATAAAFDDADVRLPSLLPGWSRGHVLTHVARNADGGTRMLTWARTGFETPEYPSRAARAAEIEAGSNRPAAVLLADVRDSAARFAAAFEAMPADAWNRRLRWTSGKERPAYRAADSRLMEVQIHHVDLRGGFGPADWPADFVTGALDTVVAAFAGRAGVPSLLLVAADTGREYRLGDSSSGGAATTSHGDGRGGGEPLRDGVSGALRATDTRGWRGADRRGGPVRGERVRGPQASLLAWLLGRSTGADLADSLPRLPPLF